MRVLLKVRVKGVQRMRLSNQRLYHGAGPSQKWQLNLPNYKRNFPPGSTIRTTCLILPRLPILWRVNYKRLLDNAGKTVGKNIGKLTYVYTDAGLINFWRKAESALVWLLWASWAFITSIVTFVFQLDSIYKDHGHWPSRPLKLLVDIHNEIFALCCRYKPSQFGRDSLGDWIFQPSRKRSFGDCKLPKKFGARDATPSQP